MGMNQLSLCFAWGLVAPESLGRVGQAAGMSTLGKGLRPHRELVSARALFLLKSHSEPWDWSVASPFTLF